jgi:hypothetical protein
VITWFDNRLDTGQACGPPRGGICRLVDAFDFGTRRR